MLRGYGDVGVNPLNCPIEVYIACWEWGAYLGPEALDKGVDVVRQFLDAHGAEYAAGDGQSRRELHEFAAHPHGSRCQRLRRRHRARFRRPRQRRLGREHLPGAGRHVYTPPLASSVLPGITRNSIIELCAKTWASPCANR